MTMEWAADLFGAVGGWDVWLLLTGVLVLCWGLVIAAMATLFGSRSRGRITRAARRGQMRAAGSDRSRRGGLDNA